MKTVKEILDQEYVNAKDLQILIPGMSYSGALKYLKRIKAEMSKKNYYIPEQRTIVVLTKLVVKDLGI